MDHQRNQQNATNYAADYCACIRRTAARHFDRHGRIAERCAQAVSNFLRCMLAAVEYICDVAAKARQGGLPL
jgi:hypothetical protein